jgi:hypothetical protein
MRRSLARFIEPESSFHTRSWADFITTMVEFKVLGTHTYHDERADAVAIEPGGDIEPTVTRIRRERAAAIEERTRRWV